MANETGGEGLRTTLRTLLRETFEKVEGIYLDGGSSLLETLEKVDAAQASAAMPAISIAPEDVGAGGGTGAGTTIAGQVEHIRFYLEATRAYVQGKEEKFDWKRSWRVTAVTPVEWLNLRRRLQEEYEAVGALLGDFRDERAVNGALAIGAHTAYHLGAIRQMVRVAGRGA